MPRVWVSLGSNQARESSLAVAISRLRAHYGEQRLSPVYESEALGFTGEPFLNLVPASQSILPHRQSTKNPTRVMTRNNVFWS